MSEDNKKIKVTDRRMFTAEGELREEYRFLEEAAAPGAAGSGGSGGSAEPASGEGASRAGAPAGDARGGGGDSEAPGTDARDSDARDSEAPNPVELGAPALGEAEPPPLEIPGTGPGPGVAFYDLVAFLAEQAAHLLNLQLPPDQEDRLDELLEAARVHIDFLDVLRRKTRGNLDSQELALLEDALYRLRMAYVDRRG